MTKYIDILDEGEIRIDLHKPELEHRLIIILSVILKDVFGCKIVVDNNGVQI